MKAYLKVQGLYGYVNGSIAQPRIGALLPPPAPAVVTGLAADAAADADAEALFVTQSNIVNAANATITASYNTEFAAWVKEDDKANGIITMRVSPSLRFSLRE